MTDHGSWLRDVWQRLEGLHDAYFVGRWRSALQREATRQEDTFKALLLLDALGVQNPAAYETLELYPEMIEGFHQWHRRMGVDRLGDAGMCC